MKKCTISSLVTLFLLTLTMNLFAQADVIEPSGVPYMTPNSVMYGADVIIDNQPTENQRDPCLSVAFNGWVYAAFYVNSASGSSWAVYRSTDDGETWSLLKDQSLAANWYVKSLDIVVTGTDEASLKLFVARVYQNDVGGSAEIKLQQYDANNGNSLATPYDLIVATSAEHFEDVAIASDYRFPAVDASPYSVGMVYSAYNSAADTIRVLTSSDGGNTITGNQLVTATGEFVRNVSIAYGRSSLWFNGRYFVAWESRLSSGSEKGKIYTSHSDSHFYDPFTSPVRLDDKCGPATEDYALNPTISCQFNDADNDVGDLTEIVLFERLFNGSTTDHDIVGCYDKTPLTGSSWASMYIDQTVNMAIQPHLNFDPGYNNFMLTYANITDQKLRYLVMDQNLSGPSDWWVISDKYNDANNLVNPYPQVEIHPIYNQTVHMWIGDVSGNGVATFDAEYPPVGIKDNNLSSIGVSVYPNPATTQVTFGFDLAQQTDISIQLYTLQAKEIARMEQANTTLGFKTFTMDVSTLPEGCYIYRISAGDNSGGGRLIVQK